MADERDAAARWPCRSRSSATTSRCRVSRDRRQGRPRPRGGEDDLGCARARYADKEYTEFLKSALASEDSYVPAKDASAFMQSEFEAGRKVLSATGKNPPPARAWVVWTMSPAIAVASRTTSTMRRKSTSSIRFATRLPR